MNSRSSSFGICIPGFQVSSSRDFQEMSSILKKNPVLRSDFDIIRVQKTFLELFPFFKRLEAESSDATISTLIREMNIEFQPRMKTLFKIGDFGTKFYLIMKGSVYVLVREKEFGLKTNELELEHSINMKYGSFLENEEELAHNPQKSDSMPRQQNKIDKIIGKVRCITKMKTPILYEELNDEEILRLQYPDIHIDRVMEMGEAFGELALSNNEAKRMATIVCKEDCYFGVISKNCFQTTLKSHFDRVLNQNLIFFKNHPLFSDWNEFELAQFYRHIDLKTFVKNQMVYQEGEVADCFYLIKEGEIEISQKIRKKVELKSKNDEFQKLISKITRYKANKNTFALRVSLLEIGQIFGLEELVAKTPRIYQAQCISASSTLYCIAKKKFVPFVHDFNTLSKLLEIKKKVEFHRNGFLEKMKELRGVKNVYPSKTSTTISTTEEEVQANRTRIPKKERKKERELINLEKFDGKLHCFHSKMNYLGEKSEILLKRIEENRKSLNKNTKIALDIFVPKKNKPNSRPFRQVSYIPSLNYPKRSNEKTSNFDSFFSKTRFSRVNLFDFSEESDDKNEFFSERGNKSKNLKKKMKECSEFDHYFPNEAKKTAEKRLKLPSLRLSGINLQYDDPSCLIKSNRK